MLLQLLDWTLTLLQSLNCLIDYFLLPLKKSLPFLDYTSQVWGITIAIRLVVV